MDTPLGAIDIKGFKEMRRDFSSRSYFLQAFIELEIEVARGNIKQVTENRVFNLARKLGAGHLADTSKVMAHKAIIQLIDEGHLIRHPRKKKIQPWRSAYVNLPPPK